MVRTGNLSCFTLVVPLQNIDFYLGALAAVVLFAVAVLHISWAFKGSSASALVVPTKDGAPLFVPSRTATFLVAAALFLAVLITLGNIGWPISFVPQLVYKIGSWTLGIVFLARSIGDFRYVGLFKKVRGSAFGKLDSRLYTPLCTLLACIFLILAVS